MVRQITITTSNTSVQQRRIVTVPEPFNFHTVTRSKSRSASIEPISVNQRNSVPKRTLTRPISPKLATSKRCVSRSSTSSCNNATRFSDTMESATNINCSRTSITKMKPFTFHTQNRVKVRDTISSTHKNENIVPNNSTFHAQPVRTQLGYIPHISPRPLTVPEPFHFSRKNRSLNRIDSVNESNDSKKFCFKAKPMPNYIPFIPKRSTKPLTLIPDDLHLETGVRAFDREKFDKKVKEKFDF